LKSLTLLLGLYGCETVSLAIDEAYMWYGATCVYRILSCSCGMLKNFQLYIETAVSWVQK